jgi:hypothetical protein
MALSTDEKEAFVNAALALVRETERTQSLDQSEDGDIHSVPDGTAKKTLAINRRLTDVFRRIYRNYGIRAIRFRGKLFVLSRDDNTHMGEVTLVEDSQVETIDG